MEVLQAGDPRRVGPYTVLRRLGAGGMGTVYLARSSGGRTVALKVVRTDLADQAAFQARFAKEVDAARMVSGAYTAAVVDAAPDARPPWMATAFVPGLSLGDAVAKHGPLQGAPLHMLVAGIAEALKNVHAARLVHRDLKPGNVMLALDGPHVIDFGITRALDGTSLTATDAVIGSPGYMSPEQALNNELTPASDVFSLAATAYYAATGEGAFGQGTHAALLFRVVGTDPDLGPVPEPLRTLLAACFAKDPAQRPTPAQIVEYIEDNGTSVGEGSWLPPGITADIVAVRAAIAALPAVSELPTASASAPGWADGIHPGRQPWSPPPPPSTPPPTPPQGQRGPSRRALLIGAGSAVALAGAGTAAVLLKGLGGSSDSPTPAARYTLASTTPAAPARSTAQLTSTTSGIALAGDLVVSFGPQSISAVGTDGSFRWGPTQTIPTGTALGANGLVVDRTLYFCGLTQMTSVQSSGLVAVDTATGAVAWSLAVPEPNWFAMSVIGTAGAAGTAGSVVYVSGSHMDLDNISAATTPGDGFVWAVDTAARKTLWTASGLDVGALLVAPPPGVPLLAGRSTGINGSVVALDRATGAKSWKADVPGAAYLQMGATWETACLAADRFVVSGSKVVAFEALTGKPAWDFDAGTAQPNFGWPVAAPDGRTVFVAGQPGVFALDAATGKVRWRTVLEGGSLGTDGRRRLRIADGNLYVPDDRSTLWAVDPATGAPRWRFADPNPGTPGAPAVAAGGGAVWFGKGTTLTMVSASGT
ncbi:protein kinase domain-containing protein [Yinghuangia aomiensis]